MFLPAYSAYAVLGSAKSHRACSYELSLTSSICSRSIVSMQGAGSDGEGAGLCTRALAHPRQAVAINRPLIKSIAHRFSGKMLSPEPQAQTHAKPVHVPPPLLNDLTTFWTRRPLSPFLARRLDVCLKREKGATAASWYLSVLYDICQSVTLFSDRSRALMFGRDLTVCAGPRMLPNRPSFGGALCMQLGRLPRVSDELMCPHSRWEFGMRSKYTDSHL
ncbi:hypothetical protein R3P38DRAFT_1325299 [Favolaschia claudopus]|uniref:Uncharacterized protein n=1 Tax=Favolaschia claudopus TaxID=2862362 RepID=A0AAW0AWI9_9AGAR